MNSIPATTLTDYLKFTSQLMSSGMTSEKIAGAIRRSNIAPNFAECIVTGESIDHRLLP